MLTNTIPNPIEASIFSAMSRKVPSSILRPKAPTSLMGVTKTMCQAPLLFVKTLAISGIQPIVVFHLVATLCENGGTSNVMFRSKNTFVLYVVPHLVFEVNRMKVSKVQLGSWQAILAKLHDLPTQPVIDRANVIPRLMVVHNEKGVFQLKGASTHRY